VRSAAIISDGGRAAARCGGGAVMGSKNLKVIVVRGRGKRTLPPAFLDRARRAFEHVRDHPNVIGLRDWGAVHLVTIKNHTGDLPARNHHRMSNGPQLVLAIRQSYGTLHLPASCMCFGLGTVHPIFARLALLIVIPCQPRFGSFYEPCSPISPCFLSPV